MINVDTFVLSKTKNSFGKTFRIPEYFHIVKYKNVKCHVLEISQKTQYFQRNNWYYSKIILDNEISIIKKTMDAVSKSWSIQDNMESTAWFESICAAELQTSFPDEWMVTRNRKSPYNFLNYSNGAPRVNSYPQDSQKLAEYLSTVPRPWWSHLQTKLLWKGKKYNWGFETNVWTDYASFSLDPLDRLCLWLHMSASVKSFVEALQSTVIVQEAHKPKFMVVNRNDLDVLFSRIGCVWWRMHCF